MTNRLSFNKENNKGVALITAMMIVTVTGIISTNLLWDNILDTRRTMTTLNRDQAIQVALGAESWIMKLLRIVLLVYLNTIKQKRYISLRYALYKMTLETS